MAPLTQKLRDGLPDSAFAYVDARGRRRLPVNDAAHVRNALARFNQVVFDDEDSRRKALGRVLRAAKRFGIVPVGFMTGQLRAGSGPRLPTGAVTLLFADIEDSTGLLRRLGDRYPAALDEVRRLLRRAVHGAGGVEVDARGDELFAAFEGAAAGLSAALAIQRGMAAAEWPDAAPVRLRVGLHTGEPLARGGTYVGIPVNTAARVCSAGHGGQILLTAACRAALVETELAGAGVLLRELGAYSLKGLEAAELLFQVEAPGLAEVFPALRAGPAVRAKAGRFREASAR